MFRTFFRLAAQSPGRRWALRRAVVAHALVLAGIAVLVARGGMSLTILGQLLLVAGIVEGALLVGWRLTQLPKSQALEFLLVSPLRPDGVLVAEAAVGLTRLTIVTLAGLPALGYLAANGVLSAADVVVLLGVPLTWGAATGLGLAVWAYEPLAVRRVGERVMIGLILVYLIVGVLAAEKLKDWLMRLPPQFGQPLYDILVASYEYSPFGVMRHWTENGPATAWARAAGVGAATLLLVVGLAWRAAKRLQPHFHDRHYQPALLRDRRCRGFMGDRPLTWWAVRRVSEYSGRINLWLASGFCGAYEVYTVMGDRWPAWLGRNIFLLCDRVGGPAALAAALVVLAAVPAAFQYGLWDPSGHERCKRLEVLLLTRLGGRDYWHAAVSAAWSRGRGYFAVALLLWGAAVLGGRIGLGEALAAFAAAVLLWGFYFTLGFRAFSRGRQANGLGLLLTVALPLLTVTLYLLGWSAVAGLLPPGSVFAATRAPGLVWLIGPVLIAGFTLVAARQSQRNCDDELRHWYDRNHGQIVMA